MHNMPQEWRSVIAQLEQLRMTPRTKAGHYIVDYHPGGFGWDTKATDYASLLGAVYAI